MPLDPFKNLILTSDLLRLVGEVDEFKGAWKALGNLAPDRLATLRQITTVESVGASTRIEGARLSDREVDLLLSNLDLGSFRTLQKQPAWEGRPVEEQLRRFMGSGGSRKIRYARLLVDALDLEMVPRPLDRVLAHVI